MKKLFTAVAVFTALAATQADATTLTLSDNGYFPKDSTLDGVPFNAFTPFTYEATFDPTTDTNPLDGVGVFDTVVTFHIGSETYTSDPLADVNVVLLDPTFGPGLYGAGLINSITGYAVVMLYQTATPAIDADVPVPTTFSTVPFGTTPLGPVVIPLLGGAGDLVITGLPLIAGPFFDTAEITAATPSAVPEPGSLLLFGSCALSVLARMRRRKQR